MINTNIMLNIIIAVKFVNWVHVNKDMYGSNRWNHYILVFQSFFVVNNKSNKMNNLLFKFHRHFMLFVFLYSRIPIIQLLPYTVLKGHNKYTQMKLFIHTLYTIQYFTPNLRVLYLLVLHSYCISNISMTTQCINSVIYEKLL